MPRSPRLHTIVLLTAVCGFMAVCAWNAAPWWEYAFFADDSPVSWLSSALLLANAAVALRLTLERSVNSIGGSALTVSLVALALDEQFLLHERIKEASPGPVNDWPTWLVFVGGVLAAVAVWRGIVSRPARLLLVWAVGVGLLALLVDLLPIPATIRTFEEALEVIAETLFLSGLLAVPSRYVQSAS